jgi:hypothetical protein
MDATSHKDIRPKDRKGGRFQDVLPDDEHFFLKRRFLGAVFFKSTPSTVAKSSFYF